MSKPVRSADGEGLLATHSRTPSRQMVLSLGLLAAVCVAGYAWGAR